MCHIVTISILVCQLVFWQREIVAVTNKTAILSKTSQRKLTSDPLLPLVHLTLPLRNHETIHAAGFASDCRVAVTASAAFVFAAVQQFLWTHQNHISPKSAFMCWICSRYKDFCCKPNYVHQKWICIYLAKKESTHTHTHILHGCLEENLAA